ncbi:MAG: DUF4915 domain-containing protein [Cyanobacteria bacterium J06635_10]
MTIKFASPKRRNDSQQKQPTCPPMQKISPTSTPSLKINVSPKFTAWLAEQQLSLAFTTYQTNRLFFIGSQTNERLKIHERLFDKPMGLYAAGEQLFMSTRYQLWQFENLLEHGEKYGECDRRAY